MSQPPTDEKEILHAMKSMQTLGKTSFPSPPKDFGGKAPPPRPKKVPKKGPTKAPKTTDKKARTPKPAPPPTSPSIDLPPPKPDVNAQLFGTLINNLKTCPPGQVASEGRTKTTTNKVASSRKVGKFANSGKSGKSGNKGRAKAARTHYASSSSSSSISSSSSASSSLSSASSGSSLPISTLSSGGRGSSSSRCSSMTRSGKVALEKKKRREELLHEKIEMMTRIKNLAKNGFITTKEWDVKDDIDEIRYECYRMQRESNSRKSIKIMRRVLVTITTLVETGNEYFNPFNLRLGGFSESMMLSLGDYDDCFEQIHHKYSGRSSVGPEMQVMFTFLSAAIFHHAGNAIGGGGGGRGQASAADKKKSSVSPMSSVMSMMGMLHQNKSSSANIGSNIPRSAPTTNPPEVVSNKPRRKAMRGPGASASAIPASILNSVNEEQQKKKTTAPSMTVPL